MAQAQGLGLSTGLIVTFNKNVDARMATRSTGQSVLTRLSSRQKKVLEYQRPMSGGAHVLRFRHSHDSKSALQMSLRELENDPDILSVEIDEIIRPLATVNDYFYPQQWPLHDSISVPSGMNLPNAWDLTTGSENTVVAVVDTGILPDHIDLQGKVLQGYDFIKEFAVGDNSLEGQYPEELTYFRTNDGDGRDYDPTDPGDWIDQEDIDAMAAVGIDCFYQDSTFHGTGIASIIAGNSEHNDGISGVDWSARILPIRVSGKCGGSRSDMIDAIRWAAGVDDPVLPDNPNPAKIINLSLGSNATCGFAEQAAINDARAAGAVLVAAAGNQSTDLSETPTAPAVCDNVIAVAAVTYNGEQASYSNFGIDVDISAPGGESAKSGGTPILVASNNGLKEPIEGSHFKHVSGTSAATAHVSGVLSLMAAVNPELTPYQLEQLLLQSSRPFVQTRLSRCDTSICGTGMVDAENAVIAAMNGYAEGHDPVLGEANATTDDDSPKIVTGLNGGAGSVNYLLVLMLYLFVSFRITTPWRP